MSPAWVLPLALALWADALRRVYAVGQTANDHFVAAVVTGTLGFYTVMALAAPWPWAPLMLAGGVGIWGLFFAIHRDAAAPTWVRWALAYPSQLAYAWALWAGLVWLLRVPWALYTGAELLWAGAWNAGPTALALLGWAQCYLDQHRVRRYPVPGLPARVVQLSDLHASALMHRRELDALIDRVNTLEPAVVFITGDLVMPFSEREHGYLLEALQRLRAPAWACPGNHDLPVLERLRAGLAAVGVPLLVDEQVLVPLGGRVIEVVGVNFHWRGAQAALHTALAALPPAGADLAVLLAHDPRLGAWAPPGRFGLALSGHTHGGQVALNMLGLPVSALRLFGVRDQGLWPLPGGGLHHVHRGNWTTGLPPRMGVAGEIAVFEPA